MWTKQLYSSFLKQCTQCGRGKQAICEPLDQENVIYTISKYYSSEKKKLYYLSWENCMELKVILPSEISQVRQDHP